MRKLHFEEYKHDKDELLYYAYKLDLVDFLEEYKAFYNYARDKHET